MLLGFGGVAGVAVHAQRACPSFHDFVNLLPGQVFGEDLQVGGRGIAARRAAAASGGWALRSLRDGCDGETAAVEAMQSKRRRVKTGKIFKREIPRGMG